MCVCVCVCVCGGGILPRFVRAPHFLYLKGDNVRALGVLLHDADMGWALCCMRIWDGHSVLARCVGDADMGWALCFGTLRWRCHSTIRTQQVVVADTTRASLQAQAQTHTDTHAAHRACGGEADELCGRMRSIMAMVQVLLFAVLNTPGSLATGHVPLMSVDTLQ